MAKDGQNTSSSDPRTFDKGLNKDQNDFHLPPNQWTRGRNAINNSITGDLGRLGNEPANLECISAPYPIIGFIHIIEDVWAVYSTDGTNSAIGLFVERYCNTSKPAYEKIVDDPCLGFKLENLIKGVSRPTSVCTYKLYWDDGINPSRNMEIDIETPSRNLYTDSNTTVPYIQTCVDSNGPAPGGCIICTNTPALDCNELRLALFINPICPRIEKGYLGGNLLNGSYFVVMAYAVKGQKISDWYMSNVQGLFIHDNSASSIDVFIDSIDLRYDEIIIGVGQVVNAQTVVRQAGIYSTRQTQFSFDTIFNTWPSIPIEQLPIMTPIVDKSDAMYEVNDFLIRVGPTNKLDFNYQPLANQIIAKWQSVQYPSDYYAKGNNLTGHMRDEVEPFFIQWIYDTGDKSNSYHIPGRPPINALEISAVAPGGNALPGDTVYWQVYNTATLGPLIGLPAPDGVGVILQEGFMGYWESTEFYPDKTPQIWDASAHPWSSLTGIPYSGSVIADYDLCGKPIRHHKFPEDSLGTNLTLNSVGGGFIRIMGVKFENIKAPRDNDGNLIPGIVGYNILRGARNGNRTIIAKGIINNMHEFSTPGNSKLGLYANYPYNDLYDDPFLSTGETSTTSCLTGTGINGYTPMPGGIGGVGSNQFSDKYYTFHSPDTNFNNPFLAAKEFRIYGNVHGKVVGKFDLSEKHPQEKLISDSAFLISSIAGMAVAILNINGERSTNRKMPVFPGMSFEETYIKKHNYNLSESGSVTGADTTLMYNIAAPYGVGTVGPYTTNLNETTSNNVSGDVSNDVALTGYRSSPKPSDFASLSANIASISGNYAAYVGAMAGGIPLAAALAGLPLADTSWGGFLTTASTTAVANPAIGNVSNDVNQKDGQNQRNNSFLNVFANLPTFLNFFSQGTDSFMRLIRAMVKYRDFAVRYHSHGYYDTLSTLRPGQFRTGLINQQYVNAEIIDYDVTYNINNLFRNRTVVINTVDGLATVNTAGVAVDRTRYSGRGITFLNRALSPIPVDIEELCKVEVANGSSTTDGALGQICSSWYGALKVRIRNQFGQLNNIVQLPIDNCYTPVTINASGIVPNKGDFTTVLFGGDVYINRYTEKNTFFYFYDWLYDQLEGAQFNYKQHYMITYPRFWADFSMFQTNDFTSSLFTWITTAGGGGLSPVITPSDFYVLDGPGCTTFAGNLVNTLFFDKKGWFYLFNSGVRDFFVESEINVAYRDYGELASQKFYEPLLGGSTKDIFDTNIIKSGNFYKYDKSLSISQLFMNYTSWASTQASTYDPYVAETCFVYQPKRVIYSLPAQFEGLKDGWKVFLPNNYFDFDNIVTAIKSVNKSGAMIFFDAASPVQFQGTDQLQTDLGTKLTIGDGGLFTQPMQAVINVDTSHEYASCQNRLSVINTPAGLFWISQNQGKIFSLAGGLKEVSNLSLKWWFNQYLPYRLTLDFPDFALLDNPVIGIGCQSVYDNENGLIYFSKVDYSLRKDITETLTYLGSNQFRVDQTGAPVTLGNPNFFDDASWTTSYDPKIGEWISNHDWHPTLNMPGKNTFMTVSPLDKRSIWIHNERCDLYCNYYGVDYPFEVEFMVNTGQTVNTLRSIEYLMEAYKYAENCYDRFHVLDYNFDEAVIFNTEQVSGLLKLNLSPKNDPQAILGFPVINATDIDVLFSKEENKYRFNQFWDITDDRGEFNPIAQRPIWDTEPNGYVRFLNPNNLNYLKPEFQRKKFRHYTTSVLLRKKISGDRKMLVMITNTKDLYSPR